MTWLVLVFSGRGLPVEKVLQVNRKPLHLVPVFDGTAELSQGTVHHLQSGSFIRNGRSKPRSVTCPCAHLDDIDGQRTEVVTVDQFGRFSTQPALLLLLQSRAEPQLHLFLKRQYSELKPAGDLPPTPLPVCCWPVFVFTCLCLYLSVVYLSVVYLSVAHELFLQSPQSVRQQQRTQTGRLDPVQLFLLQDFTAGIQQQTHNIKIKQSSAQKHHKHLNILGLLLHSASVWLFLFTENIVKVTAALN